MLDFKHIVAWQRAHALAIEVHKTTGQFTRLGHATLRSQLKRSAGSVAANIVEGCGAATKMEFARFLDVAIKSSTETEYHLIAARDQELLAPDQWGRLNAETSGYRSMYRAFARSAGMQ